MYWRYRLGGCCKQAMAGMVRYGRSVLTLPNFPTNLPEFDSSSECVCSLWPIALWHSPTPSRRAGLRNFGGADGEPNHVTGQKEVARDSV